MIDVENKVYTEIRTALVAANPDISVSGIYTDTPSSFPHVSIEETDNAGVASASSNTDREYAANLTYTVNIYTNTQTAKSDAKAIAAVVSDAFLDLGFLRSMKQEMPNIDRTIYRLTLRFQGTAWKHFDGVDGHYNITIR